MPMSKWKHITMFDRPYPADKKAEAALAQEGGEG